MKCENCGKNEVNFFYQSNINGRIDEKHLCSECAEKLGYTQAVAAQSRRMMQSFLGGDMLGDFFTPFPRLMSGSLFGENLFDDFFQKMPAVGAGAAVQPAQQKTEQPLLEEKECSRFSKMRQMNALRLEQKAAVLREDFERAAQIRDEIRQLESTKAKNQDQERPHTD